jgi:hypothetical protein
MSVKSTWVGLLIFSALAGCGGAATAGSPAPASCVAYANDNSGTIVASYESSVGAIRQLPAVANNPQLASYADNEQATVCYIDGQIPKGPPPPASGTIPASFDRAVLVVVGGQTYPVTLGYSQNIPVQAP